MSDSPRLDVGHSDVLAAAATVEAAQHSCDREIRADGWATSGYRQDGERWTCSCGKTYIHVCDEAEGCFWSLEESA